MKPWEKTSERLVREGRQRILHRTFRRPDGRTAEFEIRESVDVVCLVAVTEAGRILIAKQFRPGIEAVVLDLPAGGVDPGERPESAARRELLEETGYEPAQLRFLAANPVSAYATNRRHIFVATGCRKVAEPLNEGQEEVEVVELSLEAFRAHLRAGDLTDIGAGYLGLDALGLL